MARIVGNLVPEDDYTHPVGPEPNFNESMYFNFFDPRQSTGGFVRIGNRAAEGRAEVTVTLYRPNGRVLFSFQRAPIADNDGFDAGGARFEVLEPSQRLRTVYRGRAVDLAEPRDMADPRTALRQNPRRSIELDLVHDAVGPMYGSSENATESRRDASEQFAKAHYEQHMATRGQIRIDDESFEIDGFGLRDHSWGPRHWQAIERYEWLTMNFGRDLGAMVSVIQRAGSDARRGGVIVRGGEIERIRNVEVEAEYEDNGLYHRAVTARFETDAGVDHVISGDVKGFIPLRNRRDGLLTHIGEGMTEWQWGERTGFGLSEFLKQVR